MPNYSNHYEWLDAHLPPFLAALRIHEDHGKGLIVSHGDKCYGYQKLWADNGIPFEHGVAIYLLSYIYPYNNFVRMTNEGWVEPKRWVIDNYPKFKEHLAPVEDYND